LVWHEASVAYGGAEPRRKSAELVFVKRD
jgi:hypothetical protein